MRIRSLAAGAAALTLLAAACGDDSTSGPPEPAVPAEQPAAEPAGEPPVETAEEPDVEAIDVLPSAIVSLSPTATEMLYAIGAGDQVIAVDDFSNFPAEAQEKMAGVSAYQPNIEAIAGLSPDLVITDGTNPDLLGQLDSLGIPHWEGPAAVTFEDVYAQIEQLGAATGHEAEAAELVASMRADVAEVVDELPELDEPLTYYHELDGTFFSVTSDTFIGTVYDEVGLVNIADAVGGDTAYPQLSAEFILAEDPDLIFLACTKYCGETAATVAARPGWDVLTAVRECGVVEMDDDVASRWGPRMVEYLSVVGDAVATVAGENAGC